VAWRRARKGSWPFRAESLTAQRIAVRDCGLFGKSEGVHTEFFRINFGFSESAHL